MASVPIAVLATEYTEIAVAVEVFEGYIKDRKKTGAAISQFKRKFPLPQFSHCRRVKNYKTDNSLRIILFPVEDIPVGQTAQDVLDSHGLSEFISEISLAKVPQKPPLTRDQFDLCNSWWPVSFHEDKKLTKTLDGSLFSKQDVQTINDYMQQAIVIAKDTTSKFKVGAVLVDPKKEMIIATASDDTHAHALRHAVMGLIEKNALSQKNTAVKDNRTRIIGNSNNATDDNTTTNTNMNNVNNSSIITILNNNTTTTNNNDTNNVDNATTNTTTTTNNNNNTTITINTNNNTNNSSNNNSNNCNDNATNTDDSSPTRKRKKAKIDTQPSSPSSLSRVTTTTTNTTADTPYLCTGLDLYITHEPCVMCAMALVHSRIRRVFYGTESINSGGLGSLYKVHCERSINHKFEVYKGIQREKCSELNLLDNTLS